MAPLKSRRGRTSTSALGMLAATALAILAGCPPPGADGVHTSPAAAVARWVPGTGNIAWQWELDHPLRLRNAQDMGTGVTTYIGAPAPNPVMYDIDGFDNPASTVAALHRRHDHVVCYIEVGAAESYRPDYRRFPPSVLGKVMPGYPDERYLDIRSPIVASVIEARIKMCARKGFDAIEPDIDDSYTDATGFPITKAENVHYDVKLANYAHGLGLSFALKNGDEPSFAARLLPYVDFVIDEQCFQYRTCGAFFPRYRRAHKAVFEVEYSLSPASFCPAANAAGFNAVRHRVNLAGGRKPCR